MLQMKIFSSQEALKTNRVFKRYQHQFVHCQGYSLTPGDILKLGRIQYAVIEVRDQAGVTNSVENQFETSLQVLENEPVQASQNPNCRICLYDTQTDENPFVSPCLCKGTSQFVHFQCLKQWIESRGYKKTDGNPQVYKWKKLDCEVCLHPFPKKILLNQSDYILADIERPNSPYIIIQSISMEKKIQKGLFLIKAQDNEIIKLGRGHQCDIRISDISVSRLHALIKYENGEFVIVDNNSKFGTLLKLQKPYLIQNEKIAVQIGRTVLTFVLKPNGALMQKNTNVIS